MARYVNTWDYLDTHQNARQDNHPEGILGKGEDQDKGAEGGHAEDEHGLAAEEVGELAEGELEGARDERRRGRDPRDLALRHAEVAPDAGRHDHAHARQERRRRRRHRRLEHERHLLERVAEARRPRAEGRLDPGQRAPLLHVFALLDSAVARGLLAVRCRRRAGEPRPGVLGWRYLLPHSPFLVI